jgi:hypothetical protein
MTRPYENELEDALVRLEGWIAEAEALAARSSDPETLRALNVELTRQVALREQYANALPRIRRLNRIARRALFVFSAALAMLFAMAFVPIDRKMVLVPVVLTSLLTILASAPVYIGAIVIRDAVVKGYRPWQFSLRTLLVFTTAIAVLLGGLIYALR